MATTTYVFRRNEKNNIWIPHNVWHYHFALRMFCEGQKIQKKKNQFLTESKLTLTNHPE